MSTEAFSSAALAPNGDQVAISDNGTLIITPDGCAELLRRFDAIPYGQARTILEDIFGGFRIALTEQLEAEVLSELRTDIRRGQFRGTPKTVAPGITILMYAIEEEQLGYDDTESLPDLYLYQLIEAEFLVASGITVDPIN